LYFEHTFSWLSFIIVSIDEKYDQSKAYIYTGYIGNQRLYSHLQESGRVYVQRLWEIGEMNSLPTAHCGAYNMEQEVKYID
jgi:hypothetical protein